MDYMVYIIYALVAGADLAAWFLGVSRCRSRAAKVLFVFFAAATNLSVWVSLLVGKCLPDNPPTVVRTGMWVLTLYIISVFPRGVLYLLMPFARSRAARAAVAVAAVGAMTIPIYGVAVGRRNLRISRVEVRSERLPAGFDGFRIVQFSDLHVGTLLQPEEETRAAVEVVNSLHPDMVIFSGDLMTIRCDEIDERIIALLAEIRAPFGVWSFVGNHDVGTAVRDTVALPARLNRECLLERQRRAGWRILDDETVWIHRGGDSLSLSGVSFPEELDESRHDSEIPDTDLSVIYEGIPREPFNITVSHIPQLWDKIVECGYGDLTLSGHYHGMQLGVDIFGFRWSPARLMHREWSGRYERDGHTLYINDGIGYAGVCMRLGMPPEITLLTLARGGSE